MKPIKNPLRFMAKDYMTSYKQRGWVSRFLWVTFKHKIRS